MKIFIVLSSFEPSTSPDNIIEWFDADVYKTKQQAINAIAKDMHISTEQISQYERLDNEFKKNCIRYKIKEQEL